MTTPTPTPTQNRHALRVVFAILLLDVIGLSMLWPVAAFIVQRYSNDALALTVLTAPTLVVSSSLRRCSASWPTGMGAV